MFKPKLFDTLKNYTYRQFTKDLMAGLIVGIVALPLAIAFGIASGVSPEKGLYTAIIAGFIISALEMKAYCFFEGENFNAPAIQSSSGPRTKSAASTFTPLREYIGRWKYVSRETK